MTGRPRALADESKRKAVCGILTVGGTREVAAKYAGVHPRTLANEIRRDPAFAAQVCEAEVAFEVGLLDSIRNAARSTTHWRAAAWELERRFPERYRRRDPGMYTADQVNQLLHELAAAILDEVPAKRHRRRILSRIGRMLGDTENTPRRQLTDGRK